MNSSDPAQRTSRLTSAVAPATLGVDSTSTDLGSGPAAAAAAAQATGTATGSAAAAVVRVPAENATGATADTALVCGATNEAAEPGPSVQGGIGGGGPVGRET